MSMTPGTRIGSFEIVRLLASGGMGEVYLARHALAGHEVALKVLHGGDDEMRALFHDEARVGARLDHANLARAHELGTEGGLCYLAMDYVRGIDLRELLQGSQRSARAVPYATAVSIVAAAAAGLEHAHRHRVVHRDVSLSNIMVTFDGDVKVIDFGIARAADSAHRTAPGTVRGKAAYMAPEQCVGDPVDARSDVFSLGVVLYELATGTRCFTGPTDFACMVAIIRGEYVAPSALIADFPPELERVIRTALAVDPANRYVSAAHLIRALRAIGDGCATGPAAAFAIARLVGEVCRDAAPRDAIPAELATRPQLPVHLRVVRRTAPPFGGAAGRRRAPSVDDDAPTTGRRALPRAVHAPMFLAA